MKLNWLQKKPLGDVDVYRAVFCRELAVRTYIAEAQDVNDAQFDARAEDSDDDLPDDESDDDIAAPAPRRLTARQQRR